MDSKTDDAARRTAALAARYGAAAFPPAGPWNDTIALLLDHRSVRAYQPDPLPVGTLETLVAAAQSAATSSNMQTWSVVAVTDPARKARLARLSNDQMFIAQAPLFLAFLADLSRAQRIGEAEGVEMGNLAYLETFMVGAIDAALAAQNAVVAAESLGLGTVYIGGLRNHPEEVARVGGLPEGAAVVFGLVVGRPDADRPAAIKPRLPQSVVLHDEAYDLAGQAAPIVAYDETARAFQARTGQDPVGWRALVLARGASAAALKGRDRLKQALRTLGFALK